MNLLRGNFLNFRFADHIFLPGHQNCAKVAYNLTYLLTIFRYSSVILTGNCAFQLTGPSISVAYRSQKSKLGTFPSRRFAISLRHTSHFCATITVTGVAGIFITKIQAKFNSP